MPHRILRFHACTVRAIRVWLLNAFKMKHLLSAFCLLLFGFTSMASQADDLKKALNALRAKDFNAAKKLIEQIVAKNSFDPGGYYALSLFYSDADNHPYDYLKAYDYAVLAEKYHSALTAREAANLKKLGVTPQVIRQCKQNIGEQALKEATVSGNQAKIDGIIGRFSDLPQVVAAATDFKHQIAFQEAARLNTYQSFQNFFIRYPAAKQVQEAKEKYDSLLYTGLTSTGKWQEYEKFYKNYPQSSYRAKAKEQYEKLFFEQTVATSTNTSTYEEYIKEHPNSPYAAKAKQQLQNLSALLPVRIGDLWGFINGGGQSVIQPIYERVGIFADGLAKMRKNGKWGFIDAQGREVIPAIYESVRDFSEGMASVMQRKNRSMEAFYIDTDGQPVFDKTYPTDGSYWPIHPFRENLAAVEDSKTRKMGFIDKRGDFVLSPLFIGYAAQRSRPAVHPFSGFSQGYAWVKTDREAGLVDTKGVFLVKGKYTQPFTDSLVAPPFYTVSFSEGLCLIEEENAFFYVDLKGNKTITIPVGFTAAPFSDGLAWTRSSYDKIYYAINTTGKTVLKLPATQVFPFCEGVAVIQKASPGSRAYFYDQAPEPSYSYIDKEGNNVFDFKFDIAREPILGHGSFKNSIACIILNGKQTYIRRNGKIIWQSTERW